MYCCVSLFFFVVVGVIFSIVLEVYIPLYDHGNCICCILVGLYIMCYRRVINFCIVVAGCPGRDICSVHTKNDKLLHVTVLVRYGSSTVREFL